MRAPYWRDDLTTLYLGDALEVLTEMPTASVDCIVTSPPYYGLRDYGHPRQVGQESDPDSYVTALQAVFHEARRVLADDGTCWLNLGDCYAATPPGKTADPMRCSGLSGSAAAAAASAREFVRKAGIDRTRFLPAKNLLGIPWRVAFALQADGWILRNDIVWSKPNAMPQSVTDRLANRYEHVFLLVKQRKYWFDQDPIREPYAGDRSLASRSRKGGNKPNTIATPWPPTGKYSNDAAFPGNRHGTAMPPTGSAHTAGLGRRPGDIWTMSTRPLKDAHFAAFPIDLPLKAIAAGCRPGGQVLDMFAGAGTTALAARQLGRSSIACELLPTYCELIRRRLVGGIARKEAGDGR